jgi:CHAD domain-containing protein
MILAWPRAAKKKSGRLIAMHPDLRDALGRWHDATVTGGPVVRVLVLLSLKAGLRAGEIANLVQISAA